MSGPRRPGRPRLDENQRRSQGVFLRLTQAEREELDRRAEDAGVTLAAFLRASGLGQKLRARTPLADLQLLGELHRLGNNFNQALVLAYTQRAPQELVPVAETLLEILSEIRRTLGARDQEAGS